MKQELQAKMRITQPRVANEPKCLTSVHLYTLLVDRKLKPMSQTYMFSRWRNNTKSFLCTSVVRTEKRGESGLRLETAFLTLFLYSEVLLDLTVVAE